MMNEEVKSALADDLAENKETGSGEPKGYDYLKTSLLVIASAVLFLTLGGYAQHKGFALGVVVTEYLIVMLPVFVAGWLMKVDFRQALRLNKIKFMTALKIIALAITALPTIYFANFMMVLVLIKLDRFYRVDIPMPKNVGELGISLLLIAFSAGLCEELMFRGMLMNAYERRFGRFWAVLCPALIFGMFHFNPMNFFGPVILGLLFGYLVIATNSIFSSMIAHMANNGIVVLMAFAASSSSIGSGTTPEASQAALEKALSSPLVAGVMIGMILIFALIAAVPGYYLFRSIRKDHLITAPGEIYQIKGEKYRVEAVELNQVVVQKMNVSSNVNSEERFVVDRDKLFERRPVVATPLITRGEKRVEIWRVLMPVIVFVVMYAVIGMIILERVSGK